MTKLFEFHCRCWRPGSYYPMDASSILIRPDQIASVPVMPSDLDAPIEIDGDIVTIGGHAIRAWATVEQWRALAAAVLAANQ